MTIRDDLANSMVKRLARVVDAIRQGIIFCDSIDKGYVVDNCETTIILQDAIDDVQDIMCDIEDAYYDI